MGCPARALPLSQSSVTLLKYIQEEPKILRERVASILWLGRLCLCITPHFTYKETEAQRRAQSSS